MCYRAKKRNKETQILLCKNKVVLTISMGSDFGRHMSCRNDFEEKSTRVQLFVAFKLGLKSALAMGRSWKLRASFTRVFEKANILIEPNDCSRLRKFAIKYLFDKTFGLSSTANTDRFRLRCNFKANSNAETIAEIVHWC